jgi:hypothetical protein
VKGYQPGGRDWRLGKGKPPLKPNTDLWGEYKALWQQWAVLNPTLMEELEEHACEHDGVLSDMFGTTPITQARALAEILNERSAA